MSRLALRCWRLLKGVLGGADPDGVIVPVHQHVVLVHGHDQVREVGIVMVGGVRRG